MKLKPSSWEFLLSNYPRSWFSNHIISHSSSYSAFISFGFLDSESVWVKWIDFKERKEKKKKSVIAITNLELNNQVRNDNHSYSLALWDSISIQKVTSLIETIHSSQLSIHKKLTSSNFKSPNLKLKIMIILGGKTNGILYVFISARCS